MPGPTEFAAAIARMSLLIPGVPDNEQAKAIILDELSSYVGTKEELDWLVRTACGRMTKFSLPELRRIYCSRYQPRDGVNPDASYEQRRIEIADAEWEKKRAQWKAEEKALPWPHDVLELPAGACEMSPAPPALPAVDLVPNENGELVQPTTKELEEQLKADMAATPKRSRKDRLELIRDIRGQMQPRKKKSS